MKKKTASSNVELFDKMLRVSKGIRVYSRVDAKEFGFILKELSPYRGEAGYSTRFRVLWGDGSTTVCCAKGMKSYRRKHFRIL